MQITLHNTIVDLLILEYIGQTNSLICLEQKYSNIVKYYNNLKLDLLFSLLKLYFVHDVKAEFSASLLQSSVSHDPSEIILICCFAAKNIYISYYYQWKTFFYA